MRNRRKVPMKRALLLLSCLLLLAAEGGPAFARPQAAPEAPPPSPVPSTPPAREATSPATPAPHDPLEEFVPHEKLEADSVVAFPVDI
jgi:hypothetical protein